MNDDSTTVSDEQAFAARIHALLDRARFEQARELVGEALSQFPEDQELVYLASYVDWALGRLDDAEKSLQHLFKLDPRHLGGRIQALRLLASRGDRAGADKAWIGLLGEEPGNADFFGEYAELLLGQGRYHEAIELTNEGLRHQPGNEHCLYVAAIAKMLQYGQLDDNTELITLAREHPDRPRSAHAMVLALEKKRRYRDAYQVSQQMLLAYPNSPEWLHNVRAFKMLSHWSMLPFFPFQRRPWVASVIAYAVMSLLVAATATIIPEMSSEAKQGFLWVWLGYAMYSWIWPPVLRNCV
jgi:tetratricopeptide (TPR) repeat protein